MEVITTHVNADFDCLGSMIAAKRLYPDAVLVFPGGQERGLRDFLLQSTLYAYGIKGLKGIDFEQVTKLILVDVRSSARIGQFAEIVNKPGLEIHVYDHHPSDEKSVTAQLEHIEQVGATTTILTHLFVERGIDPTPEEATMMMLGLYEDTGHLLFTSTTPRDYQAAAFLLEHGANLNTVADFLVREMTPEQIDLLNELLKSCERKIINGIEVAIAYASIDYYVGDISSLVHKLKDIENLNVLIVAVRMEDRIFLVGRSRIPEVHVGELFQRFGGGGHAFASSATVRDIPLVQLLDQIEETLQQDIRSSFQARHLMSAPVKTLTIDSTIAAARELMTRFNFNAIPILDGQMLVGIITRHVVEKAAHHKLQRMSVSEVMTTDFDVAGPQTPLAELQKGIMEHNQRCIPVLEDGQLVGIVTRTDLLRHLIGDRQEIEDSLPVESGRSGLRLKRKNLSRLIEAQLPKYIRNLLRKLGEVADQQGIRIYLVGGFVRDLLLRQENLDIDVVVEGDGIAFAEAFARTTQCRIRSHAKFSTAVIILPDDFKIDVASARIEYYEKPAALPRVEHSSIRHDLYRRDFTINTLTISLNSETYGQLLDFFGGQRDLKDKSIRVLHNLSLIEDPTRLFRAVRFEQRLGFRIGQQTERLMRSAVRMNLVKKVGGARILSELRQILDESQVISALRRLEQFDLLKFIDPHLHFDRKSAQMIVAAEKSSSWFELLYTGEEYQRWLVYLFCLLSPLSEKGLLRVCCWLDLQPKYQELLVRQLPLGRLALKTAHYRAESGNLPKNSEIFHWFNGLSLELLLFLMSWSEKDQVRKWISQYVTDFRKVTVLLDGNDLIELGMQPGRHFHNVFLDLLEARLNGQIRTLEDEKNLVQEKYLP
ncbi:CBS domain-containing protein [Malonomonas rubra]|uniref:CBS domain-containing protein n=1 Tax=Malonomonas rubra TaxID=57040 RepID=UPI0026F15EF1|nr:CBS domain-containing protein [Malonomonas rubra]